MERELEEEDDDEEDKGVNGGSVGEKKGGNSQIGSCKKGDEGKGKKYTETGWYICGKKFKFILSANPQFWERDTRRNK